MAKLPEKINEVLAKANRGELHVQVKDIRENADLLYSLGHQILFGLFSMVTGGLDYFSYSGNEILLAKWLGGFSIFFALSMLISMWKVNLRRKKRRTGI